MAAGGGEYRVQSTYNDTQCDISCNQPYTLSINNAYFDASTTPTVTFTYTPKSGYEITDINTDYIYNVTYQIINGNQVKITASSDVISGYDAGGIQITVTTEEELPKDLNTLFTKIADAIRTVDGTTALIPANTFPSRIQAFLDSPQLLAKLLGISLTLGENTWEQIDIASRLKIADKLWNVGDEIDVVVDGETLTFQIYGFNHDDLTSGGNAGITFGMKNLLSDKYPMNTKNTNVGGFTSSAMYTFLQGTILPKLPSDLQAVIKPVNKKTSAGNKSTTINTDSMKLFLFSAVETGSHTTAAVYKDEGTPYPIFTGDTSRIKRLANGAGSVTTWWERSPNINDTANFYVVSSSGVTTDYTGGANLLRGVCFGFCV